MANGSSARPAPSGTRDVLPDEMAELRAMTRLMIDTLDAAGYGEVRTPTLEYERAMPGSELGPPAAYRLLDEHGDSLILRSDMTLPIARIATTRYEQSDFPLRFCYLARSWRRVKPRSGEATEILQLGGELLGADPNEASAEALRLLAQVMDVSGLRDWKLAIGHAGISAALLDKYAVAAGEREQALSALATGDVVTLKALFAGTAEFLKSNNLADALTHRCVASAISNEYSSTGIDAIDELIETVLELPEELQSRVIIDFSLRPRIGYYEGLVFEVYDPAVGKPLGGGGRYDALMNRLGHETSAVGFALDTELVHAAVAGEERGEMISR